MATLDKDIDLVLVTGAGASRDLAAGGKQIPDMKLGHSLVSRFSAFEGLI